MIERLQKTVNEFENKESYHLNYKKIQELESMIKKKDNEIEDMKLELKYLKKTVK